MKVSDIVVSRDEVVVQHFKKSSSKSFDRAMADFDALVGKPVIADIERAVADDVAEKDVAATAGKSHFMILGKLDMAAALPCLKAKNLRAVQYLIGNPLIADTMIRYDLGVGLYVPLRIFISESEELFASGGEQKRGTLFFYDLPSSLLSQFKNAEIDKVAKDLDRYLGELVEAVLAI